MVDLGPGLGQIRAETGPVVVVLAQKRVCLVVDRAIGFGPERLLDPGPDLEVGPVQGRELELGLGLGLVPGTDFGSVIRLGSDRKSVV